jgi:hypothetical protein
VPPDAKCAPDRLREAAALLNAGRKIAILAGQGALGARAEVIQVAEKLGAPVAKALLGKAVLPDDSPYTTGGIGHLGTVPSQQSMQECDTLLIPSWAPPCRGSTAIPNPARRELSKLTSMAAASACAILLKWDSGGREGNAHCVTPLTRPKSRSDLSVIGPESYA